MSACVGCTSALTGDSPEHAAWWADWNVSRQARHRVAHKGAPVAPEEVETALRVAEQYINHVTEKMEEARAAT
jgi:hypothetical protein